MIIASIEIKGYYTFL